MAANNVAQPVFDAHPPPCGSSVFVFAWAANDSENSRSHSKKMDSRHIAWKLSFAFCDFDSSFRSFLPLLCENSTFALIKFGKMQQNPNFMQKLPIRAVLTRKKRLILNHGHGKLKMLQALVLIKPLQMVQHW